MRVEHAMHTVILLALALAIEVAAQTDPNGLKGEEKLPLILKIDDPILRHDSLTDLARDLSTINPASAFAIGAKIAELEDRIAFQSMVLRRWGTKEPKAALDSCSQFPEGDYRSKGYVAALSGWAAKDPDAAIAWTESHLRAEYKKAALGAIGMIWAKKEPMHAASWAKTLRNRTEMIFVLGLVIEQWAFTAPLDAALWSERLDAEGLRDLMLSKAVLRRADFFPSHAANWIAEHPAHAWLMPRVMARWGRSNPKRALDWIDQHGSLESAGQCKSAIAVEWSKFSPESAYMWTKSNLSGEMAEQTMSEIVEGWALESPLEAITWAETFKTPTDRDALNGQVLISWFRNDADEAQKWLANEPERKAPDSFLKDVAEGVFPVDPEQSLNLILAIRDAGLRSRCLNEKFQLWQGTDANNANEWLLRQPATQELNKLKRNK